MEKLILFDEIQFKHVQDIWSLGNGLSLYLWTETETILRESLGGEGKYYFLALFIEQQHLASTFFDAILLPRLLLLIVRYT